jgi:hypothetical protein
MASYFSQDYQEARARFAAAARGANGSDDPTWQGMALGSGLVAGRAAIGGLSLWNGRR